MTSAPTIEGSVLSRPKAIRCGRKDHSSCVESIPASLWDSQMTQALA